MNVPEPFEEYGDERLAQAPAFGHGKDGRFEATLVRDPGGDTRLVREFASVPYHLTGTLDTDPVPGLATLCLQDPTGGVVQGDRHRLDVTAREAARAHVTTGSATKVHTASASYVHLDAALSAGPDAHLEYLPGPTILNADARCLQTLAVSLAETATVVVGDVLVPDGLSDHDPFGFDHYHSRLEARCDGQLVCADGVDLRPDGRDPRDPATVGEYGVVGTFYVFAPAEDVAALAERLRDRAAVAEGTEAGASTLPAEAGAIVRVLGHRSTDVEATVRAAWDETREALFGVGAPPDRRY